MIILLDQPMVIIGDLIDSRKLENRKEIQNKLNAVLEKVNDKYMDSIIVPFKVTLGDEFVGVFKSYQQILELLHYMNVKFAGIKIRYGIGYGVFEEYKGQGYKHALKAIEIAKKNKFKVHIFTNNVKSNSFIMINLFLHLYFSILSNYNRRQNYIIYQIVNGKTQKEIADILETSQSSISQSLDKINWALLVKTNEIFYNLKQNINTRRKDIYEGIYIAFIGAISIKANDEGRVKGLLNSFNEKYSDIIRSNFILTSLSSEDDNFYEFQGLFYNKQSHFVKILYLIVELYSELQNLYLGIGTGDIVTKIKDEAIGMDGTAFYRAREALGICFLEQRQLEVKLFNNSSDNIYSILLSLFIEYIQRWSHKQSLAVRYKQRGLTQNEIKEKMNLSQSTVAEHLQRAGWQEYDFIIDNIYDLFYLDKNPNK